MRAQLVRSFEQWFPKRALTRRVGRRLREESRADVASLHYYLKPRLTHSATALDIGANSGLFSAPLSQLFGEVISVEPNVERARYLERALPSHARVICAACGQQPSIARLSVPVGADGAMRHSLGSIAKTRDDAFHRAVDATMKEWLVPVILVPVIKVDDLLPFIDRPIAVAKIDVEGNELNVLKGATILLQDHKPVIFIELESEHGEGPEEVFKLLREAGYRCWGVNRRELVPCNALAEFQTALATPRIVNYLFDAQS